MSNRELPLAACLSEQGGHELGEDEEEDNRHQRADVQHAFRGYAKRGYESPDGRQDRLSDFVQNDHYRVARVRAHPEEHDPDENGDHQYDSQDLNEAAGDFYNPSLPRSCRLAASSILSGVSKQGGLQK